jgi:energy-coupling factor transporter ATP-binding protein EcfA2
MKIIKVSFKDNAQNWQLSETTFDKLTLLVGASGVGKTKILKALDSIKQIALGGLNEAGVVEWRIEFTTNKNDSYLWSGQTKLSGESPVFLEKGIPQSNTNIENEQIALNGNIILKRTASETIYNNLQTVKFALNESIVSILKEEELIKPISESFKQIQLTDHSSIKNRSLDFPFLNKSNMKNISLEDLRNKRSHINIKLYLASLYCKDMIEEIKERYIEIFPLVEDIRIKSKDLNSKLLDEKEHYIAPYIQIKEKGVNKWIHETDISSGMYRTLIHLAEMYLCADGSVFLIDEFENSLGVNCIDELTDQILFSDRAIQYIITSHHPYIINNIDFSHWKLVTRKGSFVKASPISTFIQGGSSHDKFMQLIQLSQFQTGED